MPRGSMTTLVLLLLALAFVGAVYLGGLAIAFLADWFDGRFGG